MRQRKPIFGTRLQLGSPHIPSMRYAFAFNETPGNLHNYNAAFPLTSSNSLQADKSTLGSGAAVSGLGVKFDGSTTAYVDVGNDQGWVAQVTFMARVYYNTTFPSLTTVCGDNSPSGNENQFSYYLESGKPSIWTNTVNPLTAAGSSTLTASRWYTLCAVRSGSTGSWNYYSYIDGRLDQSVTGHATNPASGARPMRFGFAGSYTGAPWSGYFAWAYMWTRALSGAEVLDLHKNPWQLWGPATKRRVAGPVTAAAGGTIPTPYYYRHLAGGASF